MNTLILLLFLVCLQLVVLYFAHLLHLIHRCFHLITFPPNMTFNYSFMETGSYCFLLRMQNYFQMFLSFHINDSFIAVHFYYIFDMKWCHYFKCFVFYGSQ